MARIVMVAALAALTLAAEPAPLKVLRAPVERPTPHPGADPVFLRALAADPPVPTPEPVPALEAVWDALAACESGGRWDLAVGTFQGGLQFHPQTWDAYRDPGDAAEAYHAPPHRQVAVAERVLATQGWQAWPACSRRLGLR